MSDNLSAVVADASKVVAVLPVFTSAIAQVQADLTTSQHASVINAAAGVLNIAAQSAKILGTQGLIGHNDVNDVEQGAEVAADGARIFSEIEAFAVRLKALVKHIF